MNLKYGMWDMRKLVLDLSEVSIVKWLQLGSRVLQLPH